VGLTHEHKSWPTTRLPFAKLGRRLLMFTDGVIEQFDPRGEMFGTHRLERAFLDTRDLALNETIEVIRARIAEFRASALVKDDCTLLAIERPG
jgi:serine phosphatase RsbU (regulator of sigma subunit)